MSTEKGTDIRYTLNNDIFLVMVEERFKDKINVNDVLSVVNRSYGIKDGDKIHIGKYSEELARQSLTMKKDRNILYTFFDIALGVISKNVVLKNKDAKRRLSEMIRDRMMELTGAKKFIFEHKNEN
tara:strand:- start:660 stop:1037 length:378 start_codon:yes stop_codon:yes gene_type:complete